MTRASPAAMLAPQLEALIMERMCLPVAVVPMVDRVMVEAMPAHTLLHAIRARTLLPGTLARMLLPIIRARIPRALLSLCHIGAAQTAPTRRTRL